MKNKIIYWIPTILVSLMMLFSAYSYLTNPDMNAAFQHLGFPAYFRIELAVAKIVGVLILLLPIIPGRIKEWAYAGFGITFISASIAHSNSGDPSSAVIMPLVALAMLIISYLYYRKIYVQQPAA